MPHLSILNGFAPTSMRSVTSVPPPAISPRRALVDTSVLINIESVDADQLPEEMAISALSLAQLAAGPHATKDLAERARRQERLQRAEATFVPLPFDTEAARAYGRVYASVAVLGRKAKGHRAVDLLIAATAVAARLPLYTRNPSDFEGLDQFLGVVAIS